MQRRRFLSFVLSLSALLLGAGCGQTSRAADEGPPAALDPIGTTVLGERALLFLEYPHLVQGTPARFLAHFTVLETGEPVRTGEVTLEVGAAILVAGPKRDGLFIPESSSLPAGTFPARIKVQSEQVQEVLELGEMLVHRSEQEAALAAERAAGEEPPGAVPFLLEQQWKVRLLLALAGPRTLSTRLVLPASAALPEGASASVSSSLGGLLVAPPSGALARTGERVDAGQVLALVEHPLDAAALGQLRALDLEFDLKALDVIRARGDSEARLGFAQRERDRIVALRAEGLSTEQQLNQAEQALAVARNEAEAASRMQASLDALLAGRAGAPGGALAPGRRSPLAAPIAGSVVEVKRALGESVGPDEAVFRIIEPGHLWVEGRVSEFDLSLVQGSAEAAATFAALPGRRFELRGSPYVGQEVEPSSRTLLVRFDLQNDDGAVRPGMLADIELATGRVEAAVAIPLEAVVMDQGLPTAYVLLEGELFQRRDLELGVRDGGLVQVLAGIERGERVATRGAYVVRLAALSGASFGAGHAH
jgi:membrane fusion protein, heavy metal efflux system